MTGWEGLAPELTAWQYRCSVVADSGSGQGAEHQPPDGKPVGRRIIVSLLGLGAAGILGGNALQTGLSRVLAPVEEHDPTGLVSLLPLGAAFRYYSVTGSVPIPSSTSYRLTVSGLVHRRASYTLKDLQAMPQSSLVEDFQCVTGWRVLEVPWSGVELSRLLDLARPTADATAVRFRSFDGTYTESLTLEEARQPGVLVALRMLGSAVTHDHGGPVRMYVSSNYGYKSTKWLAGIELTHGQVPGYWEPRGYAIDGRIRE
jgi:DMSO/TMAO reductase YedYZ molybdopterin-dependent catalytic subunit